MPRADRADVRPTSDRSTRWSGTTRRRRPSDRASNSVADPLEHDRLADQEQEHCGHRADDAADQTLEHERAADEPVRRADELHHLDLPPPREDREPDRVRDQERRRDRGGRSSRSRTRIESHLARLTTNAETSSPSRTSSTPGGSAGVAERLADRLHVRAVVRLDLERVWKWIGRAGSRRCRAAAPACGRAPEPSVTNVAFSTSGFASSCRPDGVDLCRRRSLGAGRSRCRSRP